MNLKKIFDARRVNHHTEVIQGDLISRVKKALAAADGAHPETEYHSIFIDGNEYEEWEIRSDLGKRHGISGPGFKKSWDEDGDGGVDSVRDQFYRFVKKRYNESSKVEY